MLRRLGVLRSTGRPPASSQSKWLWRLGAAAPNALNVHSCDELLEAEVQRHRGSAELILLGDLIDRAPEPGGDPRVHETIMAPQRDPKSWGLARVTVLRGNHEQMLLDALDEGKPGPVTML